MTSTENLSVKDLMKGDIRKLVLDGERPVSWNTYYAGSHWSVRDKEARRVHAITRAALDPELPMFEGVVSVLITAYVKSKPMDCDNLAGKLYIDALKGWVVEEDTPDYIDSVTTRVEIDPHCPRVEIIVKQVSDDFKFRCTCCREVVAVKKAAEKSHAEFVRSKFHRVEY